MIWIFCTFFFFAHHRIPDQLMEEFSEAGFSPPCPSSKLPLFLDLFSWIMWSIKPNHAVDERMHQFHSDSDSTNIRIDVVRTLHESSGNQRCFVGLSLRIISLTYSAYVLLTEEVTSACLSKCWKYDRLILLLLYQFYLNYNFVISLLSFYGSVSIYRSLVGIFLS